MSVVQRVILLNKPFKLRGFTILQWIIMAVAAGLGLLIASKLPQDWKIGNLPLGLFVFIIFAGGAGAFVTATQMKPLTWWRNLVFYKLGIYPVVYLPHREEGHIYPDPTIIEPVKREDEEYVTFE